MDRKYKIGDYVLTEDDSVVRIHSYTEDEYYVTNLSGNILPTEYAEKSLHTNIFKEGDYVQIERCTGVPISASSYMHALVGQFGIVVSTKYDTIVVDSIIDGETHRWKWNSHDLRKVDRYLKIGDLVTMVSNDADVQYKISGYSPFGYKISHLDGGEKPGIFKIDSLKRIPKFKIGDTVTVVGISGFPASYTNDMKKTIGLNGIVIDNECGYTVQFARPTGGGNYSWFYNEDDLKLVEDLLDIGKWPIFDGEYYKIPNMFNAHKYSSRLASENFLESKRFEFKVGDRVVHNGDGHPKFCHGDSTYAFIHTRKIDEGEEVYTLKYPDGYIGTYKFPKKSLSKTGQKFNIGDKVIILDSNRPDYGEARTIYKLVDGGYLLEISATKSGSMTWVKYGTTTWADDELELIPEEPKFKIGDRVIRAGHIKWFMFGSNSQKIGRVAEYCDGRYIVNNDVDSPSISDYSEDELALTGQRFNLDDKVMISDKRSVNYGKMAYIHEFVNGGYRLRFSDLTIGSFTWHDDELELIPESPKFKLNYLVKLSDSDNDAVYRITDIKNNLIYTVERIERLGESLKNDERLPIQYHESKLVNIFSRFKVGNRVKLKSEASHLAFGKYHTIIGYRDGLYEIRRDDRHMEVLKGLMWKSHELEHVEDSEINSPKNPWNKEIKISMNDDYIHGSVTVKDEEVYSFSSIFWGEHTPKSVFEVCLSYPTESDTPKLIRFNKFKFIEVEGINEYEKNHHWVDIAHGRLYDYDYGMIKDLPGIGVSMKKEWFEEV